MEQEQDCERKEFKETIPLKFRKKIKAYEYQKYLRENISPCAAMG